MPDQPRSKSQAKRFAVQQGEPMPTNPMPDLEAVIPCLEHGAMQAHQFDKGPEWTTQRCPGGRRVRLVEVQPDYEAILKSWINSVDTFTTQHLEALGVALDAAAPGPIYRMENLDCDEQTQVSTTEVGEEPS